MTRSRTNTHDSSGSWRCRSAPAPIPEDTDHIDVSQLRFKEKLSLLSGKSLWLLSDIPRLGVPSITVADGPHGVRKPVRELSLEDSHPATCFPTACALACSWDVDLMEQVGVALRLECLQYGVSILLGPGLNLKRHPAGGRNFEYFSEDPLLSGKLAAAYIRGVQASGQVGACPKHFAVNNQESHRFVVNAIVDERTARELYYRGFEIVVKESQPATMMCSYNRLNGVYCSENKRLTTDILREEWGFDGVVMTDWGATNNRAEAIAAGMDLEMPGSHGVHDRAIKKALSQDQLSMEVLDRSAQRMIDLIQTYRPHRQTQLHVDFKTHHLLAKRVAMECAVLLKNEDNFLPLPKGTSVAVIGDFAKDHPRYQGMGSSQVASDNVVTAYEELKRHTDDIFFASGYHADDDDPMVIQQDLVDEAVEVAQKAKVVLLYIGLPEIMESEGFDRETLQLPAQHNALVEAVCAVNPNVVVVLSNGGMVTIPWADKPKAIFEGYLLGESCGAATVDLVFGVQSPCGKLSETMPLHQSDILADKYFPGTRDTVEHREGLEVGYRYFDKAKKDVLYPFGHGLTYTTFEYTTLSVEVVCDEERSKRVDVKFSLQNTGSIAAAEIVQCYVHHVDSKVYRPEKELRDFMKVRLDPGESREVNLILDERAFAFYDIGTSSWVVERGNCEVWIGESSRDIRLKAPVQFLLGQSPSISATESYPPEDTSRGEIDNATFEKRFGFGPNSEDLDFMRLPLESSSSSISGFHRNSLLKEIAKDRLIGRLLLWIVYREAVKEVKPGRAMKRQKKLMRAAVENLPLRALVLFSNGALSWELLDACISIANWEILGSIKGFSAAIGCALGIC